MQHRFLSFLAALFLPAIVALAAPSSAEMRTRLDAIRSRLPEFKTKLDQLRASGKDIAYPLVSYTVLDNFTTYALADLKIAVPSTWSMTGVSGAAASCGPVRDVHSGDVAMKLLNATKQSPNVYGPAAGALVPLTLQRYFGDFGLKTQLEPMPDKDLRAK